MFPFAASITKSIVDDISSPSAILLIISIFSGDNPETFAISITILIAKSFCILPFTGHCSTASIAKLKIFMIVFGEISRLAFFILVETSFTKSGSKTCIICSIVLSSISDFILYYKYTLLYFYK